VVVRIRYASVNYKDALTARGKAKIAIKFPLVAGIDLAGIVDSSEDARFRPGDWLIPLPKGLTLFEAGALGVAGHTAALAIDLMQLNGLAPDKGKVLVNGATGGVASVAIDILSKLGFHVVALTGKGAEAGYLRSLGAASSCPGSRAPCSATA
jgi:alcohol dehydrogenase